MLPLFVMYVLLIPCVALYLYIKRSGRKRLSVILKASSTGIILLTSFFGMWNGSAYNSVYSALIVAGLLMGLVGDVTIEYSFTAGMSFFGIGHIFYIAAILLISENIYLGAAFFIFLCLLIYVLYAKSGLSFGKLLIPCALYSIIILLMLSLAATVPLSMLKSGLLLFAGAVLFTLSDTLLAFINFGSTGKRLDIICLYCYFLGQSIFAVSIYFIR